VLKDIVRRVLEALMEDAVVPKDFDVQKVACDVVPRGIEGHVATNAALLCAKSLKTNPRTVADTLKPYFERHPDVERVTIAGAGFINLTLQASFWHNVVRTILSKGPAFGHGQWGGGQPVNVEYVSTNPTGPIHIGHGRIAIVGDVIANLLNASGFKVTREYYINDQGAQVDVLARSLYRRYMEACGQRIEHLPAIGYGGDYLIPVGEAMKAQDGDVWLNKPEDAWLPVFRDFAIRAMMDDIRQSLDEIGIHFDVFTSERDVCRRGLFEEAHAILAQKGLADRGTLPPPKTDKVTDWVPEEMLLFKAESLGEPQDAALKRPDGSLTYFGGDVAYHQDKLNRGFKWLVNIWGADHANQVGRLSAAINHLTDDPVRLSFVLCQIVHVLKEGEAVKMSKRSGNFVCLDDVRAWIGADVLRFIMVTREADTQLTFDIDTVTKTSSDNPVFYVHYAYARSHSVVKAAIQMFGTDFVTPEALFRADITLLCTEVERELIQKMALWPSCVEGAARSLQPHRIANFLTQTAALFHGLWNQGQSTAALRFLQENDPALSQARLALVVSMQHVLKSGLDILGITARERLDW
jgi:arginyl-tRNA synthetase